MKRLLFAVMMLLGSVLITQAASQPTFPGGEEAMKQYIQDNMKYPKIASQNGIEGIVPLQFIVKADGTITSVKVTRMIDPDLEAEAIRLVKSMPTWIPAQDNGQAVESSATIAIEFRLSDD